MNPPTRTTRGFTLAEMSISIGMITILFAATQSALTLARKLGQTPILDATNDTTAADIAGRRKKHQAPGVTPGPGASSFSAQVGGSQRLTVSARSADQPKRARGLEPLTYSLEGCHSTTELRPRYAQFSTLQPPPHGYPHTSR